MSAKANEEPANADDGTSQPLAETGRKEREYVRRRLRAELGREPDDNEIDEWLRAHTEGY
jgi:DNA-directed RNA polymerase specialized sigma subunit